MAALSSPHTFLFPSPPALRDFRWSSSARTRTVSASSTAPPSAVWASRIRVSLIRSLSSSSTSSRSRARASSMCPRIPATSTGSGSGGGGWSPRRSHRSSSMRANSRRWWGRMRMASASSTVRARSSSSSSRCWRSAHRSSKPRWLDTSSSRSKPGGRPASSGWSPRRRRAKPWRVVSEARSTSARATSARRRRSGSPSWRATSSRLRRKPSASSAAAFSVKVMAAISSTAMPSSTTRATMRPTRAVVFPVPAPASTNRFSSSDRAIRSRGAWSPGTGPVIGRLPAGHPHPPRRRWSDLRRWVRP